MSNITKATSSSGVNHQQTEMSKGTQSANSKDVDDFEKALNNKQQDKPVNDQNKNNTEKQSNEKLFDAKNLEKTNQGQEHKSLNLSNEKKDLNIGNEKKNLSLGDENKSTQSESAKSSVQITSPLDSLFGVSTQQSTQGLGQAQTTQQVQATTSPTLSTLNDKLVETILVSQPDAGSQEVRLVLNKDVMADTEIHLIRDNSGMLSVKLVSDNPASFQTLVQTQHDLKTLLEQNEKSVNVEVSTGENTGEGDSNRRSSTYADYKNEDEDK